MNALLTALLFVYLPTLVVCALFYAWSRKTEINWFATLLKRSSLFSAIYFLIIVIAVSSVASACDGNIFKGLSDCTLLSDSMSRIVTAIGYMSYAIAMLYALILFTAGGLVELLRPTLND